MKDDDLKPTVDATTKPVDGTSKPLQLEQLPFDTNGQRHAEEALRADLQASDPQDQLMIDRIANEALVRHEIGAVLYARTYNGIHGTAQGGVDWEHARTAAIVAKAASELANKDQPKAEHLERTRLEAEYLNTHPTPAIPNAEVVSVDAAPESEHSIENRGSVTEDRIKAIPEEIEQRFRIENRAFTQRYFLEGQERVAIVEHEHKIVVTPKQGNLVAADAAKIADAKGWTDIRVTGTDAFRREVWKEANLRGIEVSGYEPTEQDKRDLDQRLNSIEAAPRENQSKSENEQIAPKVSLGAVGDTRSTNPEAHVDAERRDRIADAYANDRFEEAIRKYPELLDLRELEHSAAAFAVQRIEGSQSQRAFVDAVRDRGIDAIAKGKPLPEATIRGSQRQMQKEPPGVAR